jgi:SH3-like domain-containing protein
MLTFAFGAKSKVVSTKSAHSIVRAKPDPKAAEVFRTGKYYPLKIIDTYYSWYKVVDFEGSKGWIYSKIVTKDKTIVIKKKANVRTGPGLNYEIYWQGDKYSSYKVLEQKGQWVKINDPTDDTTGWIFAPLVWGAVKY